MLILQQPPHYGTLDSLRVAHSNNSHYAINNASHPNTNFIQLASREDFVHANKDCIRPDFLEGGPTDDNDNLQAHSIASANVFVNDVVEWPLAAPDDATDNCGLESTLATSKTEHEGGCAGAFTDPLALPTPLLGRPSQQTRSPPSSPAFGHALDAPCFLNRSALDYCGNEPTLASSSSLHVGGFAGALTGPHAPHPPLLGHPSQQTCSSPSSPVVEQDLTTHRFSKHGAFNLVTASGNMHACRPADRTKELDGTSAFPSSDFCHNKSIGAAHAMRNRSRTPERGRNADQVRAPINTAPSPDCLRLTSAAVFLSPHGHLFSTSICEVPGWVPGAPPKREQPGHSSVETTLACHAFSGPSAVTSIPSSNSSTSTLPGWVPGAPPKREQPGGSSESLSRACNDLLQTPLHTSSHSLAACTTTALTLAPFSIQPDAYAGQAAIKQQGEGIAPDRGISSKGNLPDSGSNIWADRVVSNTLPKCTHAYSHFTLPNTQPHLFDAPVSAKTCIPNTAPFAASKHDRHATAVVGLGTHPPSTGAAHQTCYNDSHQLSTGQLIEGSLFVTPGALSQEQQPFFVSSAIPLEDSFFVGIGHASQDDATDSMHSNMQPSIARGITFASGRHGIAGNLSSLSPDEGSKFRAISCEGIGATQVEYIDDSFVQDNAGHTSAPLITLNEAHTSCGRTFDTFACYPPSGGGYNACDEQPYQQPPRNGTQNSLRAGHSSQQHPNVGDFRYAFSQMHLDLTALEQYGAVFGIDSDPIRVAHAYHNHLESAKAHLADVAQHQDTAALRDTICCTISDVSSAITANTMVVVDQPFTIATDHFADFAIFAHAGRQSLIDSSATIFGDSDATPEADTTTERNSGFKDSPGWLPGAPPKREQPGTSAESSDYGPRGLVRTTSTAMHSSHPYRCVSPGWLPGAPPKGEQPGYFAATTHTHSLQPQQPTATILGDSNLNVQYTCEVSSDTSASDRRITHQRDSHLDSTGGVDANSFGANALCRRTNSDFHSTTNAHASSPRVPHARSRTPVRHRVSRKGNAPPAPSHVRASGPATRGSQSVCSLTSKSEACGVPLHGFFKQIGAHSTTAQRTAQGFTAHESSPYRRPAFDTFARYPPPGGGYTVGADSSSLELATTGSFAVAYRQMQRDLNALSLHGAELGIHCDPIRASFAYMHQLEGIHGAHLDEHDAAASLPSRRARTVAPLLLTPPTISLC